MAEQLVIESPDFDQIRKDAGVTVEDSIRLLWFTLNDEISKRRKQRVYWEDADYSTLSFTASAGTWSVGSSDETTYRYARFGDLLFVAFRFFNTSTSVGMGTDLYFTLPFGITIKGAYEFTGPLQSVGGFVGGGKVISNAANRQILTLQRDDGAAWPSSRVDDLSLRGSILLQVD